MVEHPTEVLEDPTCGTGHNALPSPTRDFICTIPQVAEQIPMSFKVSDLFDPNFDLVNVWPDLTNENLFDKEKCRFSGKGGFYEAIEPALRLASRIIISYPNHYAPFITRSTNCEFVREEDVPAASPDTLLRSIRAVIPYIDIDEDMYERMDEWAMTALEPNQDRDVVLLDFKLLENCKREWVPIFQKYISWVTLALLLCHQMAHILEFRIVRKKSLHASGAAFLTPPGVTCREAGVAWEVRALGGTITPVCAKDHDFSSKIGLSLRSAAWNFYHMAISNKWIRAVFSEEHWNTEPNPLHIPFNPVLSLESQVDNGDGDGEESSMGSEMPSMPATPMKERSQRADVVVHTSSRRPRKNLDNRGKFTPGRFPRNGCKIVRPTWPIAQGVPSANVL